MGKQNVRKVYPDFGEMLFHFKTKNLKPCSGFKPIAYKDEFFTEVCKKLSHGGTTANLYKIVRDGLIAKLLSMDASIWMQANILKGVNLSFPPQTGENKRLPFWSCCIIVLQN